MAVVHQDMGLIGHLTVSENIGVGNFVHSRWTGRINWKRQAAAAREILERLQLDIDPLALVETLPAAHRATVAIARALRGLVPGEGLLLLDEATRSLPRSDLAHVHALIHRVAESGTAVLMVSHSLDEVLTVTDKVTVLRDGRVVAAGVDTESLSEAELARRMLGKTVEAVVRDRDAKPGATIAAEIKGLRLGGHAPLDLTVRSGEIVGVTGLPGTGFEQLPYVLGGGRRSAGTVRTVKGESDLERATVERQMKLGVALVPERRIDEGLAVGLSVRDNLALPSVRDKGRPWYLAKGWQDALTRDSIARFGIKARSGDDLISELSGGNQQKVLFAKWLSVKPDLLVLHEPTQAVDVGARADLLTAICATAAAGAGVLLISTEPADLAETCDRVLVIHPGRTPVELRTDNPDDVLDAVYSTAETAETTPHPTATA
jgi:ribose transport system ATP-binding protein